jgi:hypothetical protein
MDAIKQVISFVNSSLAATQKISLTFSLVDTTLRNSVRMSQLVDGSSTKLDYCSHGTVFFDLPDTESDYDFKESKDFRRRENRKFVPLSFYTPSTRDPSSGMTVMTRYTVLQDEVSTRDDFYPCVNSLPMLQDFTT